MVERFNYNSSSRNSITLNEKYINKAHRHTHTRRHIYTLMTTIVIKATLTHNTIIVGINFLKTQSQLPFVILDIFNKFLEIYSIIFILVIFPENPLQQIHRINVVYSGFAAPAVHANKISMKQVFLTVRYQKPKTTISIENTEFISNKIINAPYKNNLFFTKTQTLPNRPPVIGHLCNDVLILKDVDVLILKDFDVIIFKEFIVLILKHFDVLILKDYDLLILKDTDVIILKEFIMLILKNLDVLILKDVDVLILKDFDAIILKEFTVLIVKKFDVLILKDFDLLILKYLHSSNAGLRMINRTCPG